MDHVQQGSLLAVKLELIFLTKPDCVPARGNIAAAAVEAFANQDRLFQPCGRGKVQLLQGLQHQEADLFDDARMSHARLVAKVRAKVLLPVSSPHTPAVPQSVWRRQSLPALSVKLPRR